MFHFFIIFLFKPKKADTFMPTLRIQPQEFLLGPRVREI
jgi:hypothetical protein